MAVINVATKEIHAKIVYYGPGFSGKTTNLEYIYRRVPQDTKGELLSLATETERTLFFDFLPVDLGSIRGFKTRFHLYTVPGQVFYDASRKLILKGVDGVVFVADSQVERMEANQESMQNLYDNMAEYGYDLTKMPFVIQYNKRDLPNVASIEEMNAVLQPGNAPVVEAYRIGDQTFVQAPGPAGFVELGESNPLAPLVNRLFDLPATLLDNLIGVGAQYVQAGTETVNGRPATRYTGNVPLLNLGFVDPSLQGQNANTATTIWVANDRGVLVAAESFVDPQAGPGGAGNDFRLRLEVADIGQVGPLAVPR